MRRGIALWTGGKDCSLALHEASRAGVEVSALATFAPPGAAFLAHPLPFLKRQAEAMGLPHRVIELEPPLEAAYENALRALREEGFSAVVTGDIAEVGGKPNWIRQVSRGAGLEVLTPLWGRDRRALMDAVLGAGFRMVMSLVKKPWFTRAWVGRLIDRGALRELEEIARRTGLDVCGENGEYHTLVVDGPIFETGLRIAGFEARESGEMMYMDVRELAERPRGDGRAGLCGECGRAKRLSAKGGATIYLCGASAEDAGYAKYPRLPMLACGGFDPLP